MSFFKNKKEIERDKDGKKTYESQEALSRCWCYGHMLEITFERWFADMEAELIVALWNIGREGEQLGWKEKIRWCWHILKTGMPWNDSVMLKKDDVLKLTDFLNKGVKDFF